MVKDNNQLENLLLAKAVRRFKRTNLRKIEGAESTINTPEKSSYIVKVDGFDLNLSHYFEEENEVYSLVFFNRKTKTNFDRFDNKNKDYAPLLEEAYQNIQERIRYSKEKEEKRTQRKAKNDLRRLKRIL